MRIRTLSVYGGGEALIQVTPTTVRRWEATPGALNLHAAPWEALRALYRESREHQGRGF